MTDDPELQELFTDPAHQEVVDLLKAGQPGTPPLDPNFRSFLRAKLMTEAERTLPAKGSRPWFGLNFRPRTLALSMAAVAAGFLVVLGVQVYLRNAAIGPGAPVTADVHLIDNKTDVAAAVEPIQIPFSGPVDKNAVADSVVIEPATAVTKQWIGQTLVITPQHPLAPNTSYTVRLQPAAVPPAPPAPSSNPTIKPTPAVAPTPVVVHFSTVRAPIPPVVPPSYKSSNLSYGHDSRLADAGTILNATWTSGGQILATRPAGQAGPGQAAASASPSATASASPSSSAGSPTDVWLLTPDGKPIRMVAQGATLPSAPASGNLFAAWIVSNGQAQLVVRDLQATAIATVATVSGTPQQPALWLGSDRLAYIEGGDLKVVDLHGTAATTLALSVSGNVVASPSGALIAVQGSKDSVVIDLSQSPAGSSALPAGATAFAWSAKGDLAFLVPQASGTDLYVAPDGKTYGKIASSQNSETWSDLNWSPDAASLLLATHPAGSISTSATRLLVVNRDGSNQVGFGAFEKEYSTPQWSPRGDMVLFTRRDEATGGTTFQVATVSTSGNNGAEQQALSEVNNFMNARVEGNSGAAMAELDSNGQAAYSKGTASLLSPAGLRFHRYYPVTVQLRASNPNQFLIGVRTFLANATGTETGFFEEQLTVLQQGQRYVIHDVAATPIQSLSHGPSVVSLEVLPVPGGQQVQVRFDADLKPETVTSDTIAIKDGAGNPVRSQVSFDPDSHLATVLVHLRPGTTYQLVVTTGLTDINGTSMAQEYDAPLVISR